MSLVILSEGQTSETEKAKRDKRANWITFRAEISSTQRREERRRKRRPNERRESAAAVVIGQIWID